MKKRKTKGRLARASCGVIMIFDTLCSRIAEKLELPKDEITPESKLSELGLDSLDIAELLLDISDLFGVDIEITPDVMTVGDVVEKIQSEKK